MSDTLIGKKLGDYVIQEILGRGGMAHVYRGYDPNLQRFAAVKVIDSKMLAKGNEEEYRARFRREARAIARLTHPNIVGVYQFGEFDSMYYMAMEFIDGRDLGLILKELALRGEKLPPRQIVRIIHDIASALDYAHAANVIHRDVKPSNIMVTSDGRAVLTDFGLALDVPEGTGGNTFGSAHYIAPEQAISSRNAVPQSDLYSLGIVLYQMVTGRVPFDDASAMSVALKHLSDPPPPPRMVDPQVSVAVEQVILRILEKEPSKRYKSGELLARSIEEAMLHGGDRGEGVDSTSSRPSRLSPHESMTGSPPKRATREMSTVGPDTISLIDENVKEARRVISTARTTLEGDRQTIALPVVVGGIVGAVALLLILLNMFSGPPPTPTAVAAAVTQDGTQAPIVAAVTETVTAVPPTPTEASTAEESATAAPGDTLAPSETLAPTQTDTSTSLPSSTSIPTRPPPTDTPPAPIETPTLVAGSLSGGVVVNPEAPLVLVYDEDTLVLFNRSNSPVSVSGLVFRQQTPNGLISFEATTWQTEYITRLPAGDCLMLWRIGIREVPAPDYCRERQAWFAVGTPRRFWLSGDPSATFDVFRFGNKVATCPVNRSDCGVS
ncbi:MAG: protein kinase [Chloroflexi bacterium]|nr:protein kinase [Chloroflexota bacterium]